MPERFSRTALLIGNEGLAVLARSKVAVFGLGGVGSFVVEGLARAGIGEFYLVDFDTVDVTNINRQIHALSDTVGYPKAELMAERVRKINPGVLATSIKKRYLPGSGNQMIPPGLNYLVDAIDDIPAKVDLIASSLKMNIPVISAMGAGNKLDPCRFMVDDISRTSVCPLAKIVRKRLKEIGLEKGVKVVFSTEKPVKPSSDIYEKQVVPASISFVPAVAGLIIAGVVTSDLLIKNS